MHRARMAASSRRPRSPSRCGTGYHLVTDCLKANQGNKSHKDVEATTMHLSNTYLHEHPVTPVPDG